MSNKQLLHDTGSTIYLVNGFTLFSCPSIRFPEMESSYPVLSAPAISRIWNVDEPAKIYDSNRTVTVDTAYTPELFAYFLSKIPEYQAFFREQPYACLSAEETVTDMCTLATWQPASQHVLITTAQRDSFVPLQHERGAYCWKYENNAFVARELAEMYDLAEWQTRFLQQLESDMHAFIDAKYPPRTQQSLQVHFPILLYKQAILQQPLTEQEQAAQQDCLAAASWAQAVQAAYYALLNQILETTTIAALFAITWDFEAMFGASGTVFPDPQIRLSQFFGYEDL